MKKRRKIICGLLVLMMLLTSVPVTAAEAATMYENSDFIETEQPELSAETKALIALYQQSPTEQNYLNLRAMVIDNYNAVLVKKEAKLDELRAETSGKPGGDEVLAEMEEIVQEMYVNYWSRINSNMLRFTDTRLLTWRVAEATRYEYIPVMGAGESIYIKRTPVTNAEYATYLTATGAKAPSNWTNGTYPAGEADYPVNEVSYADAERYCAWLTVQDGVNTYRLPSESEWELAAGHMPKDADFNCGINDGRTPVDQYASVTRGAHGAVDFWGNVWEWTSTVRSVSNGVTIYGVKGGSWQSDRTDCRTEYRDAGKNGAMAYEDVGFRVIQVKNGVEPTDRVTLTTLDTPIVTTSAATNSITLTWQPVAGATDYQLFEYFPETGLVQMLETTSKTSFTITGLADGSSHSYIVQPISYREIADNVAAEYSVTATCGETAGIVIEMQIGNPTMQINGETQAIDDLGTAPVIINGRTLLPVRAVVEAMGGKVDWHQDQQTAVLTMNDAEIQLVIDSTTVLINGTEARTDVAPVIIGGRTMLPIRLIAENFGFTVTWEDAHSAVIIQG